MKTETERSDWASRACRWLTATRFRRAIVALTGPIWASLGLVIMVPWMLWKIVWEGDPGKLARWIWTGSSELKRKEGEERT